MSRPAVLVVDPEATRRKELSRGLSGFGYEVIPAVDETEGRRFAEGLGPGVVVAPVELADFGGAAGRTLLLLGRNEEEGRELPEGVLFLVAQWWDASTSCSSAARPAWSPTPTWNPWSETFPCCRCWSCCAT